MIGWKFEAQVKNVCKQTFCSKTGPTVVDITSTYKYLILFFLESFEVGGAMWLILVKVVSRNNVCHFGEMQ